MFYLRSVWCAGKRSDAQRQGAFPDRRDGYPLRRRPARSRATRYRRLSAEPSSFSRSFFGNERLVVVVDWPPGTEHLGELRRERRCAALSPLRSNVLAGADGLGHEDRLTNEVDGTPAERDELASTVNVPAGRFPRRLRQRSPCRSAHTTPMRCVRSIRFEFRQRAYATTPADFCR
jgi:hypothetical protein